MMEEIRSYAALVLTRATSIHIPEDGILLVPDLTRHGEDNRMEKMT
jgi:hypothetical protein